MTPGRMLYILFLGALAWIILYFFVDMIYVSVNSR